VSFGKFSSKPYYLDHILKEGGGTWGDAIRARRQT